MGSESHRALSRFQGGVRLGIPDNLRTDTVGRVSHSPRGTALAIPGGGLLADMTRELA